MVSTLKDFEEIEIVHRDIKFGNILFCDNRILLADFGTMKKNMKIFHKTLTKSLISGTESYLSP